MRWHFVFLLFVYVYCRRCQRPKSVNVPMPMYVFGMCMWNTNSVQAAAHHVHVRTLLRVCESIVKTFVHCEQ